MVASRDIKKARRRVIFNKGCAIGWVAFGLFSFYKGWQNLIALTWVASVYANVKTDWGTAEAADNTEELAELKKIRELLESRGNNDRTTDA